MSLHLTSLSVAACAWGQEGHRCDSNWVTATRNDGVNPLNAELNPICHFLALLVHPILHVSRISVKDMCSNKHATKEYSGVQGQLLKFSTLAPNRTEKSVQPSRPFYPQFKPSLPFEYETRWLSEGVLRPWSRGMFLVCFGNRAQTCWSKTRPE
jgi:hypothetical protein